MTQEKYLKNKKNIRIGIYSYVAILLSFMIFLIIYISIFNFGTVDVYSGYWGNSAGYINIDDVDPLLSRVKIYKMIYLFLGFLPLCIFFGIITYSYINNIKFDNSILNGKPKPTGQKVQTILWSILLFSSMIIVVLLALSVIFTNMAYFYENYSNDEYYYLGIIDSTGNLNTFYDIILNDYIDIPIIDSLTYEQKHELLDFIEETIMTEYENGNQLANQFIWQQVDAWITSPFIAVMIMYIPAAIILPLFNSKATEVPIIDTLLEHGTDSISHEKQMNSYNNSYMSNTTNSNDKEIKNISTKGKALLGVLLVTSLTALTLLFWRIFTHGTFFTMNGLEIRVKEFFGVFNTILIISIFVVAIVNIIFTIRTLKTGNGIKLTSIVGIVYGSLLAVISLSSIIIIPAIFSVIMIMVIPSVITLASSTMLLLSNEDGSEDGDTMMMFISGIITAAIISLVMKFSIIFGIASLGLAIALIVMGSISMKKESLAKLVFILAIVLGSVMIIESIANAIMYNNYINNFGYVPINTTDNYTFMYVVTNLPASFTLIGLGAVGLKKY